MKWTSSIALLLCIHMYSMSMKTLSMCTGWPRSSLAGRQDSWCWGAQGDGLEDQGSRHTRQKPGKFDIQFYGLGFWGYTFQNRIWPWISESYCHVWSKLSTNFQRGTVRHKEPKQFSMYTCTLHLKITYIQRKLHNVDDHIFNLIWSWIKC